MDGDDPTREEALLDFLAPDALDREDGTVDADGTPDRALQHFLFTSAGKPISLIEWGALSDVLARPPRLMCTAVLSRVPVEEEDAEAVGDEWVDREFTDAAGAPVHISFEVVEWSISYGAAGDTDVFVRSMSTLRWYLLRRDAPSAAYADAWVGTDARVIELVGRFVHIITEEPNTSWEELLQQLANPADDRYNSYNEADVLEHISFITHQLDFLGDGAGDDEATMLLCPVYARLRVEFDKLQGRSEVTKKPKKAVASRGKSKGSVRTTKTGVTASFTHQEYRTQTQVVPSPIVARVWGEFWKKNVDTASKASKPTVFSAIDISRELELVSANCKGSRPREAAFAKHRRSWCELLSNGHLVLEIGSCVEIKGEQPTDDTFIVVVRDIYEKTAGVLYFHYQQLVHARKTLLEEQGQPGDLFAIGECGDRPVEDIKRVVVVHLSPRVIGEDVEGDPAAFCFVLRGFFRERTKKDAAHPYIGLGLTRVADDFLTTLSTCPGCVYRDELALFLEPRVVTTGAGAHQLHYRGEEYGVGDCVYLAASFRKADPLAFDDATLKSKNYTPAQLFGSDELAPNSSGYFRPEMWEERDARQRVMKEGIVFKDDAGDEADEPDENADAEGIKSASSSKSNGRRYIRPGQAKDGDAGDLDQYPPGVVRCPGFGNENWRDRLAMKRYKEAHAHLKERTEHIPHVIGRIVAINVHQVELAMFARRTDSNELMALTDTEREVFYTARTKSVEHTRIVGRCIVEPRVGALAEAELLDWVKVPHRFFAFRQIDAGQVSVGVPRVHLKAPAAVPPLVVDSTPNGLKVLDLFAGAGGLSSGFESAGFDIAWAVERDPAACETLKRNHPTCHVYSEDINHVLACIRQGLAGYPSRGQVDVVVGGPPCQGFSGLNRHVERRKGEDPMNAMMVTYLSIIEELRPSYFCMENVKGLLSAADKKIASLILNTLVQLNYQIRFALLQAGHYGVPQDRKRVILIGTRPGCSVPVYPTPTHCFQSVGSTYRSAYMTFPSVGAAMPMVTVRDAITDLPPIQPSAEAEDDMASLRYLTAPRSDYARLLRGRHADLLNHVAKAQSHINQLRFENVPVGRPGADWRDLPDQLIPFCLPNTSDRHNDWAGLYGRLAWDWRWQCLLTSPNPFRSIVVHPVQNRLISVRECARAMGYPDHFEFKGDLKGQYRQNGNAVPVPLARAIALEVAKAAHSSGLFTADSSSRVPLVAVVVGDAASRKPVEIAGVRDVDSDENAGVSRGRKSPSARQGSMRTRTATRRRARNLVAPVDDGGNGDDDGVDNDGGDDEVILRMLEEDDERERAATAARASKARKVAAAPAESDGERETSKVARSLKARKVASAPRVELEDDDDDVVVISDDPSYTGWKRTVVAEVALEPRPAVGFSVSVMPRAKRVAFHVDISLRGGNACILLPKSVH